MLVAASSTPTNLALVLIGLPAFLLGCLTIWDRIQRHQRAEDDRQQKVREAKQREEDRRTIDLVGYALFGPDKSQWPTAAAAGQPPLGSLVQAVANQVQPSNGKTVANTLEEIKHLVIDQGDVVKDLQKGMASVSVLVAEHVSDGHGGQRSW